MAEEKKEEKKVIIIRCTITDLMLGNVKMEAGKDYKVILEREDFKSSF